MRKIILGFISVVFFNVYAVAQTALRENNESKEEFVIRVAPKGSFNTKILLEDKLNSESDKIIFCYSLLEPGNLVKDGLSDSSLCLYTGILCEVRTNEYSSQFFKTTCSYRHTIKIENAQLVESRKTKELQVNVTENVRGPGGVLRGVTRNYVYRQKKEGPAFIDIFESVETKY